jgi:hypothetical protein
MRNLLLPSQPILTINLSSSTEIGALLEQNSSQDNLITHDGLMMIGMSGAVWAVVAVYVFAGVTGVCVCFETVAALCELEGRFGDYLVEGECAAGEGFAGIAMARYGLLEGGSEGKGGKWMYQRTWLCCSCSRVTSHSVWPQWHFPTNVVIVYDEELVRF